jgi:two-component system CheB/CheR fusion protein
VILNKYGREVFGVEGKDVIGKNILDLFPQIQSSAMYHNLQRAFQTGEIIQDAFYRSNISDRIIENFFIPLFNGDREVYRVLVIGHDITEISEAHDKLKQVNKELEKSNQDLEQFAFEKKLDDKEAAQNYISKVISSAARMTDLIKAVLNYSRLSNEKGEFETVDLNEVIENIKNDLELTINEKQAVIETGKLPVIQGNPLQLNQLFLNLISNSIKFSKQKPEISISSLIVNGSQTKAIDGFTGNGKYAELIFKDNGIGFEQQYAEKIFTVFQRLHGKQEYPGTGIGLALCKKIITNHNGNISVTSTPGEGTTFKIYLPLNHTSV